MAMDTMKTDSSDYMLGLTKNLMNLGKSVEI